MKTPFLHQVLPTCCAFTAESLCESLEGRCHKLVGKFLHLLKEASIRDQNFEQAQTFRAAEKALKQAAGSSQPSALRSVRRKPAKSR